MRELKGPATLSIAVLLFAISLALQAGGKDDEGGIDAFFSAEEKNAVKNGDIITRAEVKGGGGYNLRGRTLALPGSSLVPSSLRYYEVLAEERAFMPFDISGTGHLKFYNGLFAYSRFKGLKYYSRTDKRFQPYILESGRVSGPESPSLLADPVYTAPAPRRAVYFRIRDNRFGDMMFLSEVVHRGEDFLISSSTTKPLSKMGVPIARAGEYRMMSFYFYSARDRGYFYYGLHAVRVRSGFFISSGLVNAESFANRLRAETVRRAGIAGLDWGSKLRL